MKVLAVATILTAAVTAAPTKDWFPFPIVPLPFYGPPGPPFHGGIPPLNGGIPPLNGGIPPLNGGIPPLNGGNPPLNGGNPPVNGGNPPVDGVIPPVDGVIPPVDGVIPPVGGNNGGNGNTLIPPPATGSKSTNQICPAGLLNGNLQCCAVDVLGVADLDCHVPSREPVDGADFGKICAETGKQAHCCGIPVAGQALLCQPVIGAN